METLGTLTFQLLVLIWGVGLPAWVITSLVKNPGLTPAARVLLAGLTVCDRSSGLSPRRFWRSGDEATASGSKLTLKTGG